MLMHVLTDRCEVLYAEKKSDSIYGSMDSYKGKEMSGRTGSQTNWENLYNRAFCGG